MTNNNENQILNKPVTDTEITSAFKTMKNNKSRSLDSALNEHLKASVHIMLPVYTKLSKIIFDIGLVPESWTVGNILPIYKNKGNSNLLENCRPITLLSYFGKLLTSILYNRLNQYPEENEVINACQAGFRKGFSTADKLFLIQKLTDISKANKK